VATHCRVTTYLDAHVCEPTLEVAFTDTLASHEPVAVRVACTSLAGMAQLYVSGPGAAESNVGAAPSETVMVCVYGLLVAALPQLSTHVYV